MDNQSLSKNRAPRVYLRMPDQGLELKQHLTLLEPTEIASLRLKNRIVVAPMTCVSATDEGIPTEQMASYKAFADGEFGLSLPKAFIQRSNLAKAIAGSLAW